MIYAAIGVVIVVAGIGYLAWQVIAAILAVLEENPGWT
jgi:hypothetical protein